MPYCSVEIAKACYAFQGQISGYALNSSSVTTVPFTLSYRKTLIYVPSVGLYTASDTGSMMTFDSNPPERSYPGFGYDSYSGKTYISTGTTGFPVLSLLGGVAGSGMFTFSFAAPQGNIAHFANTNGSFTDFPANFQSVSGGTAQASLYSPDLPHLQNVAIAFFGTITTITDCGSTAFPQILMGDKNDQANITACTVSALTGQKIVLTASLPEGVKPASQRWYVNGNYVGGFEVAPSADQPETGRVADPPDLTQDSITFYWVEPKESLQVTYQYTLSDEETASASATFSIQGPGSPDVATKLGIPTIVNNHLSFSGDPAASGASAGIVFSASASLPQSTHGIFQWVQILLEDSFIFTASDGTQTTCTAVGAPNETLDTGAGGYPYSYGSSSADSPDINLIDLNAKYPMFLKVSRTFRATMYLMWNPLLPAGCYTFHNPGACTSIPVPLGSVTWVVTTAASKDPATQQWGNPAGSGYANIFQPSPTYSTWTTDALNGINSCVSVAPVKRKIR